ncbi:hypothetical protein MSPP1_002866 [Malassezia sp. CBS 17886]|nr:hypothetical protein MSPP1_002866 [Malassezia sp. CBS 17886]
MADATAARRVLARWHERTFLALAEAFLSQAALLREASVLCAQLDTDLHLQFAVVRTPVATSAHEAIMGLTDDDVCVRAGPLVRVIDLSACAIHYWTLDDLAVQVRGMHRLRTMRCNPDAALHTDARRALLGDGARAYAHVGTLRVPLFPAATGTGACWTLPVRPVHGTRPVAHVRVRVARDAGPHAASPAASPARPAPCVAVLTVDQVQGISASDMDSVHFQLHWDADVFAHPPATPAADGVPTLRVQWAFRLPAAPATGRRPASTHASVLLFARPSRVYLEKMLVHDAVQEADALRNAHGQRAAQDLVLCGLPAHGAEGRINETKRRLATSHGVHVDVCVREWGPRGATDARLIATRPKHFLLRAQRAHALHVRLRHDSNALLPWTAVDAVALCGIHLVDAARNARLADGPDVVLRATQLRDAAPHALAFIAPWETASRAASLLDTPSTHAQYVRCTLRIHVRIIGCANSLVLDVPLRFRMQRTRAETRTSVPPTAWSAPAALAPHHVHALFCVHVEPHPIAHAHDLWRADTRSLQVPGEAVLGPWAPRGLSLVRDYAWSLARDTTLDWLCRLCAHGVDVDGVFHAARQATDAARTTNAPQGVVARDAGGPEGARAVSSVRGALTAWLAHTPYRGDGSFSILRRHWQAPPPRARSDAVSAPFSVRADSADTEAACLCQGTLALHTDAIHDAWAEMWFDLRPPFLIAHQRPHHPAIVRTMFLHSAHTDVPPGPRDDKHPYTFSLYTACNSYLFAARSAGERRAWMSALAPPCGIT